MHTHPTAFTKLNYRELWRGPMTTLMTIGMVALRCAQICTMVLNYTPCARTLVASNSPEGGGNRKAKKGSRGGDTPP